MNTICNSLGDRCKQFSKRFFVTFLVGNCAFMLSGCNPDFYVSQTPQIAQFQSKSPEVIYEEAVNALVNGSYNKAISCFRALIRLYPQHHQIELVQLKLVDCYARQGQTEDAIQKIDEFISVYPNSSHIDSLKQRKAELERKKIVNTMYYKDSTEGLREKNRLVWKRLERERQNRESRSEVGGEIA